MPVRTLRFVLDALQIPEGRPEWPHWHRLTLAERIQVLYERMLHHLRQAQATSAAEQPVIVHAADAQSAATPTHGDELAEVHAALDSYGVPRVLFSVLGSDWRAHDVRARAAERLRKLHRLMVETCLPDFMPPGTVIDPAEAVDHRRAKGPPYDPDPRHATDRYTHA